MSTENRNRRITLERALVEMGFIIFLFYANLLMGEFNHSNAAHHSLRFALRDIFTLVNFCIAFVAALAGYLVFEYLRKRV